MLRLVQMAVLDRWRATGEELYREVAQLANLQKGEEVVVSGSGSGLTSEWLATRTGAAVTGVDPDREEVERADKRARATTAAPLQLTYQQADLDDLPYESNVFDAAIGEPELAAASDPGRAVAELVRVTKPMGVIILLQLTWSSELRASARELVVQRLGLRPHLLVEWKQMLRDAGAVEIQVDDWTNECDEELPGECGATQSQMHWQDKMQIVGHALRRSGWRGARHALAQERELLRELSRERCMGFSIIKGVKWPHETAHHAHGVGHG